LIYENSISNGDLPIAFDYISSNPVGKYIVWNHVSQNYQKFYNKYELKDKFKKIFFVKINFYIKN
jgi:hypothetical protein